MNKIYLIAGAAIVAVVMCAFWAGGRIATEKCRAVAAQKQVTVANQIQSTIIQKWGKINEETFNTGVIDIRNRLRLQYTIRD